MADQLSFLPERVFTAAAMPGTGYRVRFYQSGTTTPVEVYTSAALDTPHVQPIVCDASGVFPQVFSSGGAIKAVVTKPDDVVFYTLDPVFRVPTSNSGASDITFSPTGPLPYTNVQDAIEGSVAAAASGFNAFGLGITGNAGLLASIDAVNIGAGTYRFDGTTTGTYPTGVAAADTGLIEHWRQSAAVGMMELHHATTTRVWRRRLVSGAWGPWRSFVTAPNGVAEGPTESQVLGGDASGAQWVSKSRLSRQTQTLTSGSLKDFTGIPPNLTAFDILIDAMSTTVLATPFIRLGTSGGIVATGYTSVRGVMGNAVNPSVGTGGGAEFVLSDINPATGVALYRLTFRRTFGLGTHLWMMDGIGYRNSAAGDVLTAFGRVDIGAELTQVRLEINAGAFDLGSATIAW